jgi:hypothetical protein
VVDWVLVLCCFNLLFLGAGVFEAYKVRAVRLVLDSKQVALSIYNVFVFISFGVGLRLATPHKQTLTLVVSAISCTFAVGGIMLLLMVPVIKLRNITNEKVQEMILGGKSLLSSSSSGSSTTDAQVKELLKENAVLKGQIEALQQGAQILSDDSAVAIT